MKYELSFLIPNLGPKEKEELLQKVEKEINSLEGKIEEKFIEKKFFARLVEKQKDGFLGVIIFTIEAQNLKNLRKNLNSNKNILKTMIEKKKKMAKQTSRFEKLIKPRTPILDANEQHEVKKAKVKIEDLDQKLEEILE